MTQPRNHSRQPGAGTEPDDAQTDVQPNEAETVPAAEDAQVGAGLAAAETEPDTTNEAPPAEDVTAESPPAADETSDEPPAAQSVPGSLEIFTAAEEDELPVCAVCREAITPGQDFVTPAYGPVHTEPCSHQTRPG